MPEPNPGFRDPCPGDLVHVTIGTLSKPLMEVFARVHSLGSTISFSHWIQKTEKFTRATQGVLIAVGELHPTMGRTSHLIWTIGGELLHLRHGRVKLGNWDKYYVRKSYGDSSSR